MREMNEDRCAAGWGVRAGNEASEKVAGSPLSASKLQVDSKVQNFCDRTARSNRGVASAGFWMTIFYTTFGHDATVAPAQL